MSYRPATHRPAHRRRFRHDDLVAVDLFSDFGGARDHVDGYGNAVSPQVGEWIGGRLRAVLHEDASS